MPKLTPDEVGNLIGLGLVWLSTCGLAYGVGNAKGYDRGYDAAKDIWGRQAQGYKDKLNK